jgi:N-acetylmuramic acid 6-phosphate (MurNAc-6-P) etherase
MARYPMAGAATEASNPATRRIDTMSMPDIIELMILDNRSVIAAVQHEEARIAQAAEICAGALAERRPADFVGAGTSGRLACWRRSCATWRRQACAGHHGAGGRRLPREDPKTT